MTLSLPLRLIQRIERFCEQNAAGQITLHVGDHQVKRLQYLSSEDTSQDYKEEEGQAERLDVDAH